MSASFKPATSVSYTFKEPFELIRNSSAVPSSIYTDVAPRGENVSLSFRTFQSPAVLFYVSSYHREFLAVLINKHGEEEGKWEAEEEVEGERGEGARWKRLNQWQLVLLLKLGFLEVCLE